MEKKNKPIAYVLDLDDSLIQYTKNVCEVAAEFGVEGFEPEDFDEWDFPEEIMEIVIRHESLIYATAEAFECAAEQVRQFKANGIKIIMLTARPKEFETETRINLNLNGIPFDELIFDEDKVTALNLLSNEYDIRIFADDKLDTINKVARRTEIPRVMLINRPHNRLGITHPRVEKVDCVCYIGGGCE